MASEVAVQHNHPSADAAPPHDQFTFLSNMPNIELPNGFLL
ncbi:MAG: hypothetical protein WCF22_00060 [Candidatus Sulfotelmatobacter sp.]